MKTSPIVLVSLLALASAPAWAMQFKAETNLYLSQNELADEDLYAAGESVTFLGNALQDAYIAASNVATVAGTVVQDLNIAAVDAEVNAKVGDDLRVFASQVKLAGSVAGSTLILAGRVTQQRQSLLEGDVAIRGGEVRLSGTINGPLQVAAKEIILDGAVTGPVQLEADRIRLEAGARVLGRLQYHSPQEIQIDLGAQVQQPVQRTAAPAAGATPGAEAFDWQSLVWLGKALYRLTLYLGLLAMGCLLLLAVPQPVRRYAAVIRHQPWQSLGWGLLTVLGLAVVLGLLVVSLLGIPIALILLVLTFFAMLFSSIGVGYTLGLLLVKAQPEERGKNLLAFFLGLTLLAVLQLIPVVGTLLEVLVMFAGLGALWLVRNFQEPALAPAATAGPVRKSHVQPATAPSSATLPAPAPVQTVKPAGAGWKPSVPAFKKKGQPKTTVRRKKTGSKPKAVRKTKKKR
ncbi:MAG: polymer-forming cytoskeletal protein [candidate division FCPU426 bacterium]